VGGEGVEDNILSSLTVRKVKKFINIITAKETQKYDIEIRTVISIATQTLISLTDFLLHTRSTRDQNESIEIEL